MGHYSGGHRSAGDSLTLAAAAAFAVAGVVLAVAVVRDRVLLAVVVGGGLLIGGAAAVAVAAFAVWRAVDATRAHERDRLILARTLDLLTRGGGGIDVRALTDDTDADAGELVAWPGMVREKGGRS